MPRKKAVTTEVADETMKFTLKVLQKASACSEARKAFGEKFGVDGEVSAKDAFIALAEAGQRDWLFWIIDHFPGFLREVGDVDAGNWYNRVSEAIEVEIIEVHDGVVFSSGNSQVRAYDNSQVEAYDNSQVEAYGNSQVRAYGNSQVEAYGNSQVEAYGNSQVEAYGNSQVRAYDNSQVRAYDNSTIMISECYSQNVEVKILTPMAAAVDRRSGKPVLILQEEKTEQVN